MSAPIQRRLALHATARALAGVCLGLMVMTAPSRAQPVQAQGAPDLPAAAPEVQAREMMALFRSGQLLGLSDEATVAWVRKVPTATVAAFLKLSAEQHQEAEIWIRRHEALLRKGWNEQPFVNYVKFRHQPRQLYVRWLEGGLKAGQEVIFDETVRSDKMYGHLGGILGFKAMWISLTGAMARDNSNHSMKEIGLQFLADAFAADFEKTKSMGASTQPTDVELLHPVGERLVGITWLQPQDRPAFYARKVRLSFDLHHPHIRMVEAWDHSGEIIERIYIDKVLPHKWSDIDFSPQNPQYKF